MVWAIHVEISGQRQVDRFLLTAGPLGQHREVTVGRPPVKADTRPDIVVPEKSVSKIHAILHVVTDNFDGAALGRLMIADRSRFGTSVNGRKMAEGATLELRAGDMVQLAAKTFLSVADLPMVVAVHPAHPQLAEVREAAARAGIRLTHAYDGCATTTHVLYDPGDDVWSAVVQGALRGVPFVDLDWLCRVASAGVMTNLLPDPPPVEELLLGPGRPPARVPLPPSLSGTCCRGLLDGFTFAFSSRWQDPGLAALLTELGGRIAADSCDIRHGPEMVVLLNEGEEDHGISGGEGESDGGGARSSLGMERLLTFILTKDAATVRQLVGSACTGVSDVGRGRQQQRAAITLESPDLAASPEPADSDMTQAAEEDEDRFEQDVVMELQNREEVEPLKPLPAAKEHDRQGYDERPGARGLRSAGDPAMEMDWLVAARRQEDLDLQSTAADTAAATEPQQHSATDTIHEDAPSPKRRRLVAFSASAPQSSGYDRSATGDAAPVGPSLLQGHHTSRLPAPAPSAILFHSPLPTKHEPVEDVPWMTQHPQGHPRVPNRGSGNTRRISGSMLHGTALTPAVKLEPSTAPQQPADLHAPSTTATNITTKARGRARKSGAAADDLCQLEGLIGRVKEEQLAAQLQTEVLDASAQEVLEADLFAPTPDQLPQRCRSISLEPYCCNSSGGGGCKSGEYGLDAPAAAVAVLPDFKHFRKQGRQLLSAAVQPLPVFVVDNFQRTEEAEAFLRLEEERVTNKRRADEMFRSADVGSKRLPRGTRRA